MSRGAALSVMSIGGLLCLFGITGMILGLPLFAVGSAIAAKRSLGL